MVEIQFDFNQVSTMIQAQLEEPFQNVIDIYHEKSLFEPGSVKFELNGKPINLNESIESHMNKQDKKNKRMKILVTEIKNDDIIESKDIICPKCKEQCRIVFEKYKINLFECPERHIFKNISLMNFNNTQKINISKIKCNKCGLGNKDNFKKNEFFRCLSCKLNLCLSCKNNHDSKHNIIIYNEKNYICQIHNEAFFKYCIQCHEHICFSCEEHNNHESIFLIDLKPNIAEKEKILNEMKKCVYLINGKINEIIEKLNSFKETINKFYEINNNILKSYNPNKFNFHILKNLHEINNKNKIFKLLTIINKSDNLKEKIIRYIIFI